MGQRDRHCLKILTRPKPDEADNPTHSLYSFEVDALANVVVCSLLRLEISAD